MKVSDNGALATGSRNLCDDIWDSDESTCGFDRDAEGNKIWDSQVNTKKSRSPPPSFKRHNTLIPPDNNLNTQNSS